MDMLQVACYDYEGSVKQNGDWFCGNNSLLAGVLRGFFPR